MTICCVSGSPFAPCCWAESGLLVTQRDFLAHHGFGLQQEALIIPASQMQLPLALLNSCAPLHSALPTDHYHLLALNADKACLVWPLAMQSLTMWHLPQAVHGSLTCDTWGRCQYMAGSCFAKGQVRPGQPQQQQE